MVLCMIQVLVYLMRSMVPAYFRGAQEERLRRPDEPSAYSANSKLETPMTVANDVKPEPRWHGAAEEDILSLIRLQASGQPKRTSSF